MPQIPKNPDPKVWPRYFAVECYNQAWDIVEQARTAEEDQKMLHVAQPVAHHWSVVGDDTHQLRAKMLLAEVHA